MSKPTGTPWSDCKVAFDVDNDVPFDDRLVFETLCAGTGLPRGWVLDEVDGTGARWVAVFRVSVFPTKYAGKRIRSTLRAIGAIVTVALALALLCATAAHANPPTSTPADESHREDPCGEERAVVKLGLDPEADRVSLEPVETTIAELVALKRPAKTSEIRRASDVERTVYRVQATLVAYKVEKDSDVHVVIADQAGHTMIVEIPSSNCAAQGAWHEQVAEVRRIAESTLRPTAKLRRVSIPVTVTGVGFFDKVHGQAGVAKSGIELHPLLAIEFGGAQ